jgi:pyruvate,water dikinase
MIRSFQQLTAQERPLAGGKGATLARLYQAGYPVPDGFIIFSQAFSDDELLKDNWDRAREMLDHLRQSHAGVIFAVRSSALSEDSHRSSFAGEFDTILDLYSNDEVRKAIHAVRRSRKGQRAQVYSDASGLDSSHDMAVVVQRMVPADLSGLLFSADPVTGSRAVMAGNYVEGVGDRLLE